MHFNIWFGIFIVIFLVGQNKLFTSELHFNAKNTCGNGTTELGFRKLLYYKFLKVHLCIPLNFLIHAFPNLKLETHAFIHEESAHLLS